ncbi:MAG: LLM class F420-dependent oxidoreductase, partial [Actinomycetota bacterium]
DQHGVLALTQEADRLGYHSVWVAEAYGSDAVTVLSWLAGQTKNIGLGSGIMQMTARAPAMTAMTAVTLDILSNGRALLGLGLSGPQVVEGWYGQRYDRPLQRTREYIEIIRNIIAREGPLTYDGEVFQLPLPDSKGKALKLITHPVRSEIPIYLASIGPRNVQLTGEIADGWLPAFFAPEFLDLFIDDLRIGAARSGRDLATLDIAPSAMVSIGDDLHTCYDWIRPAYGLYLGGMGSRKDNFYGKLATRYGFGDAAKKVQDLYLSGDKFGAYQAVPEELIDATALVGPPDRIAEGLKRYEAAGVSTLVVSPLAGSVEDRIDMLRVLRQVHPD